MDKLERYREIIIKILQEYAAIPYSYGNLERRLILGKDNNNFVLLTLGW